MNDFRLDHIGINAADADSARAFADQFGELFAWQGKDGSSSVFAGSGIEVMKSPFYGEHGHIAVATGNIEAAIKQLSERGVSCIESSKKYAPDGKLKAVYIDKQIGGFAIHLIARD